jgi:hypothetical protein
MNKEVFATEINGKKVLKIRTRTPAPKVFRDPKKYNRKEKHRGRMGW